MRTLPLPISRCVERVGAARGAARGAAKDAAKGLNSRDAFARSRVRCGEKLRAEKYSLEEVLEARERERFSEAGGVMRTGKGVQWVCSGASFAVPSWGTSGLKRWWEKECWFWW